MVFQIEKDHFELNFQGQEAGFQLDGGYYKKTVSEDDLVVGFDDDNMVSKDKVSLYNIVTYVDTKTLTSLIATFTMVSM